MSTSNQNSKMSSDATPKEGGSVQDIFTALAAPFADAEVRSRRGPNGRDLAYITAHRAASP